MFFTDWYRVPQLTLFFFFWLLEHQDSVIASATWASINHYTWTFGYLMIFFNQPIPFSHSTFRNLKLWFLLRCSIFKSWYYQSWKLIFWDCFPPISSYSSWMWCPHKQQFNFSNFWVMTYTPSESRNGFFAFKNSNYNQTMVIWQEN